MLESSRGRRGVGGWVLVCALSAATVARADEACAPWPGEPDPLPTVDSADPFAAQWARLRSAEFGRLAAILEADRAPDAYVIWRRVRCFDPSNPDVAAAEKRTRLARAQRARVTSERIRAETATSEPAPTAEPPSPRVAAAIDLAAVDRRIERTRALVSEARFAKALAEIHGTRRQLAKLPGGAARRRRAQLETLAATVLVAFGDTDGAQARFQVALHADPQLRLGDAEASPKVRSALARARLAAEDTSR